MDPMRSLTELARHAMDERSTYLSLLPSDAGQLLQMESLTEKKEMTLREASTLRYLPQGRLLAWDDGVSRALERAKASHWNVVGVQLLYAHARGLPDPPSLHVALATEGVRGGLGDLVRAVGSSAAHLNHVSERELDGHARGAAAYLASVHGGEERKEGSELVVDGLTGDVPGTLRVLQERAVKVGFYLATTLNGPAPYSVWIRTMPLLLSAPHLGWSGPLGVTVERDRSGEYSLAYHLPHAGTQAKVTRQGRYLNVNLAGRDHDIDVTHRRVVIADELARYADA